MHQRPPRCATFPWGSISRLLAELVFRPSSADGDAQTLEPSPSPEGLGNFLRLAATTAQTSCSGLGKNQSIKSD